MPEARAEGSSDPLHPCSVSSAAAVLGCAQRFHRSGACPDAWSSLYLELAVSLGRALSQNLILSDWIVELQDTETSGCSSGQVVRALLLESWLVISNGQDLRCSPRTR